MWQKYQRKQELSEMRPYVEGEVLDSSVSVGDEDKSNGSPKAGDMIARDPSNHSDQWLIGADYFNSKFETNPVGPVAETQPA